MSRMLIGAMALLILLDVSTKQVIVMTCDLKLMSKMERCFGQLNRRDFLEGNSTKVNLTFSAFITTLIEQFAALSAFSRCPERVLNTPLQY